MYKNLSDLGIKIFADGADVPTMKKMASLSHIKGLTTNPTLMKKAGISDYAAFAKDVLATIKDKPISFEVFSEDFEIMRKQALEISNWGDNVYVKIPITNSEGRPTLDLIKDLSKNKVKVNVTAIMTTEQVASVVNSLNPSTPSYISVFAGRIADTGRDPMPIMKESLLIMKENPLSELIWASPRELLNVIQADSIGCHVITATSDILSKLNNLGKDLTQFSLETVQMFNNDALAAGYSL